MGYADLLLGPADTGTVEAVQDPVRRPAPIGRPGFGTPAPQRGYSEEMLGPSQDAPRAAPAQEMTPQPGGPAPEADAPSWIGRRWQDIKGKKDPRYSDTPTAAEVLMKEGKLGPGSGLGQEQWAWLTGAADKDMSKVYGRMFGDRLVGTETDANGYPLVVYRDKDGKEARAYVNKPGLDMQDVVRGTVGIAPYVATGLGVGSAMKSAALLPRMAVQGLGQAGTSLTQDALGAVTGTTTPNMEHVKGKALAAGIGGAGGELVGAGLSHVLRKAVGQPRLYDKAAGKLTAEGERLAGEAGLDVKVLTPDMAKKFADAMLAKGDPQRAVAQMANDEFKIRRTQGELSGNKAQLLREQQMQGGAYGQDAQRAMQSFRDMQEADLRAIASQEAARLAPDRVGSSMAKADIGSNISANTQEAFQTAKRFEKMAWREVPEMRATDEMLSAIPQHIGSKMKGIQVTESRTPAAAEMIRDIESFMKGGSPKQISDLLPASPVRDINAMRKSLLDGLKSAKTPEDKRAASGLYDSFNDWIETAAKMSGDVSAAAKLQVARGMTRQMHEFFTGPRGTPAAGILKKVLEQGDTPELIVNSLFSAPAKSDIKQGAAKALTLLKAGYEKYLPPEAAKAAWDDIRMAYWLRTIQQKTGEAGGPAAMSSAIKGMLSNQGSMSRMLFTADEIGRFKRLARTLDEVKQRNPNSSWSGVSLGAFMKDIGDAVLTMIGANSVVGKMAIRFAASPVRNQYGAVQARRATGAGGGYQIPNRRPLSFGDIGAATGAQSDSR